MTGPGLEIDAALSGDGPIASEQVLSWIDAAADSDLLTLSKLYRLTGEGYYRIQPELGRGPTCALIQRYLLGCIRDGFEQWGSDPRLEVAWKRALKWGDAHPDYMAGLFQRLQGKSKE